MIRILQIAHDHPDFTPGGTEILAHDLARALDARADAQCSFLAASTALSRAEDVPGSLGLQGADYVLRTGRYDRFTMTRLDGSEWIASLSRVIAAERPQVVHLHGLDRIGAEVLPVLRRLAPQAKIILTLHDFQMPCPNDGLMLTVGGGQRCANPGPDRCHGCFPAQAGGRHALRRAHLLALLRLVDVFLAPSSFLRDRFIDWGIEAGRIRLMPNAVLPVAALPAAPRPAPNRFAFFGNIVPHKGVLTLLDAARRLAGEDLRIDLHGGLIHPEPAFAQAFDTALAAAGAIVQHHGPYSRDDLPELMRRADWMVMPSVWWENAPLVLLEARAAGLPVICSGIGGMAEMVADGQTGLHVPPGDAATLAEVMREAARDVPLHRRFAQAQRKAHSPDAYKDFVNLHLEIYRSQTRRTAA
ncbi:glycosyltransferase [Paenirhodobacter sp.]|uniref:glycosyltransferase n=1 Tax=Paenirhodobacter sp. TaxID=1965326 RepID=UPI003B4250AA